MSNDNYLVSYVINARRRCRVLQVLSKSSLTAIEISEMTYIRYNYVLVKLQELLDKNLITHNGAPKSKIYSITPLGKEVMDLIYAHYGDSARVYDVK